MNFEIICCCASACVTVLLLLRYFALLDSSLCLLLLLCSNTKCIWLFVWYSTVQLNKFLTMDKLHILMRASKKFMQSKS